MAVIQKHIVKRGKRTIFRQLLRPEDNGKLAAAWRLDLDEINHALDVRYFVPVEGCLTFSFEVLDGTLDGYGSQCPWHWSWRVPH